MDYKELIEKLKNYRFVGPKGIQEHTPILDSAATVIETLLAERDAAIKELEEMPHHKTCKYGDK